MVRMGRMTALAWLCCSIAIQASGAPEKVRGAYWGMQPVAIGAQQLRQLRAHGINTALVKDVGYVVPESLWRDWARIAQQEKIRLFPVLNFAGRVELQELSGQYRPYVDSSGRSHSKTPCPLDEAYWHASFGKRWLQLARLSTRAPLAGMILDTEMYGGDIRIYGDICVCDACWHRFVEAHAITQRIAQERRGSFLRQQALTTRYMEFQQHALIAFLQQFRQDAAAINPAFQPGIMAYKPTWFYQAMIQGLGSAANPLLVFSETSYTVGYTPHIQAERAAIVRKAAQNAPTIARHIPGLWLSRFFPEELPSQLYALATHSDGYWLFTVANLWDATAKTSEAPELQAAPDAYWNALQTANREIERFQNSPVYQTALEPVHVSSFYDSSSHRLSTPKTLTPFLQKQVAALNRNASRANAVITLRGKALLHGFFVQKSASDAAQITIRHVPLAQYADRTTYTLFGEDGNPWQNGTLDRQRSSVTIPIAKDDAGRVSLLLDSGLNAARVSSKLSYVIEASALFPLSTINTIAEYRVYVDAAQTSLKLRANCAKEEPAILTVQQANETIHPPIRADEFTEINIPTGNDTAAFWKIAVTPVALRSFEDVKLFLFNQEYPYVIPE